MASAVEQKKGNAILRYFGMETGRKALEVFVWAFPYLCVVAAGLAGLSYLVQLLNPLSFWVYVVAIALSLVYLFLFLARLRQAEAEARLRGDENLGE
jgi:hypothetical protein